MSRNSITQINIAYNHYCNLKGVLYEHLCSNYNVHVLNKLNTEAEDCQLAVMHLNCLDDHYTYHLDTLRKSFPTKPVIIIAESAMDSVLADLVNDKNSNIYFTFTDYPSLDKLIKKLTQNTLAFKENITNSKATAFKDDITDYVSIHFSEKLTSSMMANHCNMSAAHFSRLFKKYFDITFTDYLTRYRISKAMDMIKQTQLPISVIAFEVGFQDVSYFTNVFKRCVGVSPNQVRLQSHGTISKAISFSSFTHTYIS